MDPLALAATGDWFWVVVLILVCSAFTAFAVTIAFFVYEEIKEWRERKGLR